MPARFGFQHKLMTLGILLTVLPILVVTGLVLRQYGLIRDRAEQGTAELSNASLVESANAVYSLVETSRALLEHQVAQHLRTARHHLDELGKVSEAPGTALV